MCYGNQYCGLAVFNLMTVLFRVQLRTVLILDPLVVPVIGPAHKLLVSEVGFIIILSLDSALLLQGTL